MYDIFISYSSLDYLDKNEQPDKDKVVSKIIELFNGHKDEFSYWYAEGNILASEDFPKILEEKIKESKILLFVSTNNSNYHSNWTYNEIYTAKISNKKIIPFKYDDTEYSSGIGFLMPGTHAIEYIKHGEKSYELLLTTIKTNLQEIKSKEEEEKQKADKNNRITNLTNDISNLKSQLDSIKADIIDKKVSYNKLVEEINTKESELSSLISRPHKPLEQNNDGDSKSAKKIKELSNRQKIILDILLLNANETISEIAMKTQVSERTIHNDFVNLQRKGIICREGGLKNGRWVIVTEKIHPTISK